MWEQLNMVRGANDDFDGVDDEDEHDPDLLMDDQMEGQLEIDAFSIETGGQLDASGMDVAKTGEPFVDYDDLFDNIDVSSVHRESRDERSGNDQPDPDADQ
jgi:hypothetical protein